MGMGILPSEVYYGGKPLRVIPGHCRNPHRQLQGLCHGGAQFGIVEHPPTQHKAIDICQQVVVFGMNPLHLHTEGKASSNPDSPVGCAPFSLPFITTLYS